METWFTHIEPDEEAFFTNALRGHTVRFAPDLEGVPASAEALSIFIQEQVGSGFLEAHPNLKLIATRSSGYDHIDADACRRRGIRIASVPNYGESTVAEHTFALLLAVARRLREAFDVDRSAGFSYAQIRGTELMHKTFGVIGSGRIGQHSIRMARAFNMRVLAYDIEPNLALKNALDFQYVPLDELLAQSDFLTLHAPLVPETYHILDAEAFAKCKRGVLVVNTARGRLIDTDALIAALDSGQVGGAGLDVLEDERVMTQEALSLIGDQIVDRLQSGRSTSELRVENPSRIQELSQLMRNSELISRPNVVFTPHIGFNSREAVQRINQTTADNISAFSAGRPLNLAEATTPSST
jgi:D-lactate dehydrogenase